MSKIPVTKGLKTNRSNTAFSSSNLLHYGYAAERDKENTQFAAERTFFGCDNAKMVSLNNTGEQSYNLPSKPHLKLSETQLNALSYSLCELADKISPTKREHFDDDEWELRCGADNSGRERSNSKGESQSVHSKTPYTRRHGGKVPLSKQKSISKIKPILSQNEDSVTNKTVASNRDVLQQESVESGYNSSWSSTSLNEDKNSNDTDVEEDALATENAVKENTRTLETKISDVEKRINSLILGRRASEFEASQLRQGNVQTNNQTKLENNAMRSDDENSLEKEVQRHAQQRQTQQRQTQRQTQQEQTQQEQTQQPETQQEQKQRQTQQEQTQQRQTQQEQTQQRQTQELQIQQQPQIEQLEEKYHQQQGSDGNQKQRQKLDLSLTKTTDMKDNTAVSNNNNNNNNNSSNNDEAVHSSHELKSPTSPVNGDSDLRKSPFQMHKVRKTSLDGTSTHAQKPVRPGLVRRRTTLVTFRPPRKSTVFNEVDDGSGVLEIDDDGFVQCLTDVRAMKTMLLKLKRELQEAEVQSPLSRSVSAMSRSTTNLINNNTSMSETADEGNRRHTYDSSEMIHKKLQRLRSQSLSRRKPSSCAESPLEDHPADPSDTDSRTQPENNNTDDEMRKMKDELDDLKQKMKDLKQERDTLFMDKEEIEHELETKNHTIKMLQKQLEAQENSDEVTCLQRQVTSLTQQVRQQQQKIAELKYRATSPRSPRRDSVKLDIKNRLRDAFTKHLEESSKSHLLLSKHIEKAELTISEAQKGLESLCSTTSHHTSSSRESLAEGNEPDEKRTLSNGVGATRSNTNDTRRHSWTVNSIDKIIKTWKETAQSIENITSRSPRNRKQSGRLSQPSSPHLSYL